MAPFLVKTTTTMMLAIITCIITTPSTIGFVSLRSRTRSRPMVAFANVGYPILHPQLHLSKPNEWNDEHVAHDIEQVHEETNDELKDSEDAAAWDAHDLSDPGMEAAAEERAVMLAAEMAHKMKEKRKQNVDGDGTSTWNDEHLAHGIAEVHEETDDEIKDSEDAAAWDAHDVSDAGMEAAAEERAVMLAAEMAHIMKEKAAKRNRGKGEKQ